VHVAAEKEMGKAGPLNMGWNVTVDGRDAGDEVGEVWKLDPLFIAAVPRAFENK
jgi:hypothetical protein